MHIRRHRGESSPAVPSWLVRRGEHVPAPRTAASDSARIAELASAAGAPVEAVLREVADFRLALETDMIIAAAAVDAEELGLAAELVDGERAGLVAFHERMLERLVEVAQAEHDHERAARRVRSGERLTGRARLVAAAAALVAIVSGGVALAPTASDRTPSTEQVALELADAQLNTLTGKIVRDASSADISVAANELHDTLETLIAEHAEGDPETALKIAELIREEQLMLGVDQSPATASVLRDVARLVRQLKRKVPPVVMATLAPAVPTSAPSPKASATPKSTASPKPSASPKPTASPTRSASASPKATSSPSDSGSGPLPTAAP